MSVHLWVYVCVGVFVSVSVCVCVCVHECFTYTWCMCVCVSGRGLWVSGGHPTRVFNQGSAKASWVQISTFAFLTNDWSCLVLTKASGEKQGSLLQSFLCVLFFLAVQKLELKTWHHMKKLLEDEQTVYQLTNETSTTGKGIVWKNEHTLGFD